MLKKSEGFIGQRSFVLPNHVIHLNQTHPLCQGLYITDIGYYPNAAFHVRERPNGSEQYIFIYCVAGEGWYSVNGQRNSVKANQFFIIPAHTAHEYGADTRNPWSIYWVHFSGTSAAAYVHYMYPSQTGFSPLNVAVDNGYHLKFNDLISHIEMSYNEDNVIYANIGLGHYLSSFKDAVYNPSRKNQSETDPVSQVIHFMKEHLSESLSLEQLAEVAGMSASNLSLVFRQKLQSSPIHFFTFLKIQRACYLLEFTNLRIKEVAYQIGYNDPFHFSRVFTNIMGKSPRTFRKNG